MKLLYLQRENKLEKIISGIVKEKDKIKYPLLGNVIKNHLINYVRYWKNESCFGAVSLDEAEEINPNTGRPKNIKDTRIKYIKPQKVKKLEGRPYIPTKTLNAPRLLFSKYTGTKIIIHLNEGYIVIADKSFEDDTVDRIVLIETAREVMNNLDKFDQKIFWQELKNGYSKKRNYKDIAILLHTYPNKIKRHIRKIFFIKEEVEYKRNKKIIEIEFKNDPYMLKELEENHKLNKEMYKTKKQIASTAYWIGK